MWQFFFYFIVMSVKNVGFGASRLQLKRFPIDKMAEHCTIAMIAKRASGKSYLTREILYHKRKIPAVVISRTEKLNRFYGEFCPDSYIFDQFDTEILSKIYERQSRLNKDNERRKKEGKKLKDDRVMLIMDDCMSSKGEWLKDPQILELFFNGRHHHMSFILTMQFSLGIPPELRSNFDYIFLLAEDFYSNLKRLYDHYAGMFPTFDAFRTVFKVLTDDFGAMVIVNRGARSSFLEKIFWYKAKNDTLDRMIGCEQFVNFHKKNFDENWRKKKKQVDIMDICVKKKGNAKPIMVDKIKKNDDDFE